MTAGTTGSGTVEELFSGAAAEDSSASVGAELSSVSIAEFSSGAAELSSKEGTGIDELCSAVRSLCLGEAAPEEGDIAPNLRQADKLKQNAEYLKAKRVNEALEQVAMFTAMYEQYAQNPDITKSRMYYEAISEILPGVKLYINTSSGDGNDIQMLLPLENWE